MQLAQMPPVAEQTVAIGGSSAASSALNAATRFVPDAQGRLPHPDRRHAHGHHQPGMPLTSGQAYYFGVTPGHKIAVIQA